MISRINKSRRAFASGIFLFCAVLLSSCGDKCDDVECQNDGTCEFGGCICPEWYTGSLCEKAKLKPYQGWYDMTTECDGWGLWYTERLRLIFEEDNVMRLGELLLEFDEDLEHCAIPEQYDNDGNLFYGEGEFKSVDRFDLEIVIEYPDGTIETCYVDADR